jgi:hypothetical protein
MTKVEDALLFNSSYVFCTPEILNLNNVITFMK